MGGALALRDSTVLSVRLLWQENSREVNEINTSPAQEQTIGWMCVYEGRRMTVRRFIPIIYHI